LSVANFDRERLRAILNSAGIDASKKNIRELDLRLGLRQGLYWAWQELPLRELGPSKELLAVRDALMRWAVVLCFKDYLLEDISSWLPEDVSSSLPEDISSSLLKAASSFIGTSASGRHRAAEIRRSALRYRYERNLVIGEFEDEDDTKLAEKWEAVVWLINATCKAVDRLETEKSQETRRRRPPAETMLFYRLYGDYCALSGRQALSGAAPTIRFVKECAKLIAPEIIIPAQLRQRIEYGLRIMSNSTDCLQN
jgi:hypothetical protein